MNYHNANVRAAMESRAHYLQTITDLVSTVRKAIDRHGFSDIFGKLFKRSKAVSITPGSG